MSSGAVRAALVTGDQPGEIWGEIIKGTIPATLRAVRQPVIRERGKAWWGQGSHRRT
jgi:hypothetical protein